MGIYRFVLFCFFLMPALTGVLQAQQTQQAVSNDAEFRRGLDLFGKQKFSEAQEVFDGIVSTAGNQNDLLVIDAEYYAAVCATELFHKDAEIRLKEFLIHHPESPRVHQVHFQLGKYNYRKKDYDEALLWFRQVDLYDLQKDELSEFYFKRGYAHYMLGHIDSAKHDFYEIRTVESKYAPPANYYYSHIAYTEGNYETALAGFMMLKEDPMFGPVVPWYVSQIYYLQGRYNDVITFAPPLLDSADTKKVHEVAHLIGASYYRLGKYKEAIPFLERHRSGVSALTRNESYELGYAYFKTDSAAKAVPFFESAAQDSNDALAQNAWYHLADCYIRTDNKPDARTAFGKASSMKFDPIMREDALFNYARLSYELSFSPFNEAIVALNNYLAEYPNHQRSDEAYALLTDVYLTSKNYQLALGSIEKIKVLNPAMQATYQKIAYNRGIELYNQKQYTEAVAHFDKVLVYPVSRELNSQAKYWKGEAWYAQAEMSKDSLLYDKAIAEYKAFLITPGATVLSNYNTANYNIGYCYFEKKNWSESAIWFRKYVTNKTTVDANERVFDAYVRLGDAYFRLSDFLNAGEFYGKAVATPTQDPMYKDYAMYQQAMAMGFQGKKQEKADLLRKMRETYPASVYLASSRYQEARTYHELKMYDQALDAYKAVYNADPKGENAGSCLTNMGLIYRTKGDPDNALKYYKMAAELQRGKGTQEFKDLMREIKEIYLSRNQLEDWEAYATSVGYAENVAVADSTAYAFAAKYYNQNNCSEAVRQANKYIQKYPSGIYITEVNYMKAECSFKSGDYTTALGSYNAILDRGQTKYTERALTQCGWIYYTQKDWANAARIYRRLEVESNNTGAQNDSKVNLMRCYLFLNKLDSAALYAEKVLSIKGLPNDVTGQAHFLKAKSALNSSDFVTAEKHFREVGNLSPNTEYAAEASYQLCWIKYNGKAFKTAEKMLLTHINDYDAFAQWSGKGWLLLSDNHLALKDTASARFVLEGYIESGQVPELVQQAKDKLMVIDAAQYKPAERKQEDMILPGENPEDNKLFDNGNGGGQ